MRFGIMTLQQHLLIPSDPAPEKITAQMAAFDHVGLVRRMVDQGFDLFELSGDLGLFFPQAFAPPAIAGLAALKEEFALSYTVHLPLWSVEPSTALQPVRRGSVQALIETIQACRPLKPEAYVLHATGPLAAEFYRMRLPAPAKQLILRLFQQQAGRSIGEILAATGIPGRLLAVETIEFPLELTLELAEQFDLSLCLDTGHVLAGFSGPLGMEETLERCLPRLAEVHLHDSPWQGPERELRYGQDHRPLGQGDLDLPALLGRLEEAAFDGPIILELTVEEALASLEVIRNSNR